MEGETERANGGSEVVRERRRRGLAKLRERKRKSEVEGGGTVLRDVCVSALVCVCVCVCVSVCAPDYTVCVLCAHT